MRRVWLVLYDDGPWEFIKNGVIGLLLVGLVQAVQSDYNMG